MEETKAQMLENMARQDAEAAHTVRHAKKRTRTVKPKATEAHVEAVKAETVAPSIKETKKPRMITCTFQNRESKGAPLRFTYNMERYEFMHGKEYKIPVYVYKHVNSLARVINEKRLSDDGLTPHPNISMREARFTLIPTIYDGDEEMFERKPIYTVSY